MKKEKIWKKSERMVWSMQHVGQKEKRNEELQNKCMQQKEYVDE